MDNNIIDKRTKGEWLNGGVLVGNNTGTIADCKQYRSSEENLANAAFIVKACNEYEGLVKANKELEHTTDIYKTTSDAWQKGYNQLKESNKELLEALKGITGMIESNVSAGNYSYYEPYIIDAKKAIKKHSPI